MYWGRKPLAGLHEAFEDVQKGEVILDPLCGGGTVAVETLRRGARIIASDLNPVAIFLTKVLIKPINIAKLRDAFHQVESKVKSKILERYSILCPNCHRQTYIDYIVWQNENPDRVKVSCPSCYNTGLQLLSHRLIKKQFILSKEKPKSWYPKTCIHSIRTPPVEYHHQLFTGRNLSSLTDLLHAIKLTKEKNCRDALLYVFTAFLYSVSKMQMFSEKAPQSSRGWTACRYYVPNKCKEKNVWQSFETRFKTFLRCKNTLNSILPYVRITEKLSKFKQGDYNVLIKRRDVFSLKSNIGTLSSHVFLDPPYDDDIDYFGFSEFWGCWLKMRFDFKDEWKSRELKSEGLEKLLHHIHNITKLKSKVILAFAPKDGKGWNEKNCIKNSKYHIVKDGYFFYDNSYKRGYKKGKIKKQFDRFSVLQKASQAQHIKNLNKRSIKQKIIYPYIRLTAHVSKVAEPEILRERTTYFVPRKLHDTLKMIKWETFKTILGEKDLNQKAYYTFCLLAIKHILKKDKWQIIYKNPQKISFKDFPKSFLKQKNLFKPQDNLKQIAFVAKNSRRKIYFSFREEGLKRLNSIANKIKVLDKNKCEHICVMIVEDRKEMNNLRSSPNNNWPRGFFTTFEEIRLILDEIDNQKELELFTKTQKISQQKEEMGNIISSSKAKIEKNIPVGEEGSTYYKLSFKAPELDHIIPGQFIMIDTSVKKDNLHNAKPISFKKIRNKLDLNPKAFLKRPFGIHRAFYENFGEKYIVNLSLPPTLATILHTVRPNKFDILYKVIENGLGTKELTDLKQRDIIQIIGPLGKRFALRDLRRDGIEEIHVIGGGVGMAPLIFMVQALRFYSFEIKAFIGIEKLELLKYTDEEASYLADPNDAQVFVDDLIGAGIQKEDIHVSTDKLSQDMKLPSNLIRSNFHHGLVTKQYEKYLKERGKDNVKKVQAFACGPKEMMDSIYKTTKRYSIPLKVLIEKRMACGTGVCLSCACKIKKNGKEYMRRVCIDGPIFDAEEIL
jgi:dihydroorotate dehydrogenase electron transfer subunit